MLIMMPPKKHIDDATLVKVMHDRALRPSLHRVAVLSYITNERTHPTADEIFGMLVLTYPSLSRTTVYNSLHALVEHEIIREIDVENGVKRYDYAFYQWHGHFRCKCCKKIFDIPVSNEVLNINMPGFVIDTIEVTCRGLCPHCINLNK